jgi:hypothetical protein
LTTTDEGPVTLLRPSLSNVFRATRTPSVLPGGRRS